MTEIKRYNVDGKRMVLYDDGEFVVVWKEKSPPQSVAANALHGLPGSRFNPMQPTVGDLVGVKSGASQELCPHDSPCSKLHASLNIPCLGICGFSGASAAAVNPNGAGHFDAMRPTVGDLVGSKAVNVAASAPPVGRRINGQFDPLQPTVGDLVDLDRNGNPRLPRVSARHISDIRSGDFLVHPRRIRESSR